MYMYCIRTVLFYMSYIYNCYIYTRINALLFAFSLIDISILVLYIVLYDCRCTNTNYTNNTHISIEIKVRFEVPASNSADTQEVSRVPSVDI